MLVSITHSTSELFLNVSPHSTSPVSELSLINGEKAPSTSEHDLGVLGTLGFGSGVGTGVGAGVGFGVGVGVGSGVGVGLGVTDLSVLGAGVCSVEGFTLGAGLWLGVAAGVDGCSGAAVGTFTREAASGSSPALRGATRGPSEPFEFREEFCVSEPPTSCGLTTGAEDAEGSAPEGWASAELADGLGIGVALGVTDRDREAVGPGVMAMSPSESG